MDCVVLRCVCDLYRMICKYFSHSYSVVRKIVKRKRHLPLNRGGQQHNGIKIERRKMEINIFICAKCLSFIIAWYLLVLRFAFPLSMSERARDCVCLKCECTSQANEQPCLWQCSANMCLYVYENRIVETGWGNPHFSSYHFRWFREYIIRWLVYFNAHIHTNTYIYECRAWLWHYKSQQTSSMSWFVEYITKYSPICSMWHWWLLALCERVCVRACVYFRKIQAFELDSLFLLAFFLYTFMVVVLSLSSSSSLLLMFRFYLK